MVLPQSVSNAEKPWTEEELARLGALAEGNIPPCVISIRPPSGSGTAEGNRGWYHARAREPTSVRRVTALVSTAEPNPIEPLGSPDEEAAPAGPDPVHPLGTPDPDEPAGVPDPDPPAE